MKMISTHIPKPKKPTATVQGDAGLSRYASRVGQIAHELINQLSVLNLIGYKVISQNQLRSAAPNDHDLDKFQRSIQEATLLAEQLAHCVTAKQNTRWAEGSMTIPDDGKVVRLLRSARQSNR
jgi:hypothetical protein